MGRGRTESSPRELVEEFVTEPRQTERALTDAGLKPLWLAIVDIACRMAPQPYANVTVRVDCGHNIVVRAEFERRGLLTQAERVSLCAAVLVCGKPVDFRWSEHDGSGESHECGGTRSLDTSFCWCGA